MSATGGHSPASSKVISAVDALTLLKDLALAAADGHRPRLAAIDVRSEGEFAQGSLPGFVSAPILSNDERHQVGLAYKEQGQAAAIELGQRLVEPTRVDRVRHWAALAGQSEQQVALVTCWRGGLRSQIACEWLAQAGVHTLRVAGGYKVMRGELLRSLAEPPPLLLLAGMTGSGKTRLLNDLPAERALDLEGAARHRGSSFGSRWNDPQPSQATFENSVALALLGRRKSVVIEDESATIGRVRIPQPLHDKMTAAPVVSLEVPMADRVENIYQEYVAEPLGAGISPPELCTALVASVTRLGRHLGLQAARELQLSIEAAFAREGTGPGSHAGWIGRLLADYYDKRYLHAFERHPRRVLFRGDYEECRRWILEQFD